MRVRTLFAMHAYWRTWKFCRRKTEIHFKNLNGEANLPKKCLKQRSKKKIYDL